MYDQPNSEGGFFLLLNCPTRAVVNQTADNCTSPLMFNYCSHCTNQASGLWPGRLCCHRTPENYCPRKGVGLIFSTSSLILQYPRSFKTLILTSKIFRGSTPRPLLQAVELPLVLRRVHDPSILFLWQGTIQRKSQATVLALTDGYETK